MNSFDSTSSMKRQSEDITPPITDYFPIVKRHRVFTEKNKFFADRIAKLDNLDDNNNNEEDDIKYQPSVNSTFDFEVCNLNASAKYAHCSTDPSPNLENMPKYFYRNLFTILDLNSLVNVALSSKPMANHVLDYMKEDAFESRFNLDYLDFMNCSMSIDDEDFLESDPFYLTGILLKAVTISFDTKERCDFFLKICRNIYNNQQNLCGFGRIIDGFTKFWMFKERYYIVKEALLIDPLLHKQIHRVLNGSIGQYPVEEMRIRSSLTELFLNRNQHIEDSEPDEILEFGSWLSILLKTFSSDYQAFIYYILFGPTELCQTGEKISWEYFSHEDGQRSKKNKNTLKTRLTALLNGVRALRIMSNSNNCAIAWTRRNIYRLFLKVIDLTSYHGQWSSSTSSMALALDSSGIFCQYLALCCDKTREDFERQQIEAAATICQVRTYLYIWYSSTSTYLSEPLHVAFKCLSKADGCQGGFYYSRFLDYIWKAQHDRVNTLLLSEDSRVVNLIDIELKAQLSILHLLNDFAENVITNREINHS